MTSRPKRPVLAAAAGLVFLIAAAVAAYLMFGEPPPMPVRDADPAAMPVRDADPLPMLAWDASPGVTHYEVQIDGTLLGKFSETRAPLPRGFVKSEHTVQVRACKDALCSPWQPLPKR